jgi:hypothetical protein
MASTAEGIVIVEVERDLLAVRSSTSSSAEIPWGQYDCILGMWGDREIGGLFPGFVLTLTAETSENLYSKNLHQNNYHHLHIWNGKETSLQFGLVVLC